MNLDAIRKQLLDFLEEKAHDHAVDIVDVWVSRQGNTPLVQVFVDKAETTLGDRPISLDEVASHTSWVSEVVDFLDIFDGPFDLEVSSPGMYRPLRKEKDFLVFVGETVKLKKKGIAGRLQFTGELLGIEGDNVKILSDKQEFLIPLEEIKKATIEPTFNW